MIASKPNRIQEHSGIRRVTGQNYDEWFALLDRWAHPAAHFGAFTVLEHERLPDPDTARRPERSGTRAWLHSKLSSRTTASDNHQQEN